MNSRERIISALHGGPTDHVPFSPFLAYVWESYPASIRDAGQLAFHHAIGADPLWRGAPCPVRAVPPIDMQVQTRSTGDSTTTLITTPVGSLSMVAVRSNVGNTSFLVEHPLKTEQDYVTQMWIEEHTSLVFDSQAVEAHFAGNGREGLSLGMLLPRRKSAYQYLVEHLVGTEALIYACVDYEPTVKALWRTMVEQDLRAVRMAAESDYAYFTTWEDSSTQNYSPSQYDVYIGSEISAWCDILTSMGKRYIQHACGHIAALVGRMKAQGVFAVESISPPPTGNVTVKRARELIGDGMGIIGGIEPTQFLQLSDQELDVYVRSVIDEAQGGPFVLANSDSCPPGVTLERFRRVAEIAGSCRL